MEDLVKKVFEEKMKNGDFEKIVSDKLDDAIKSMTENIFGYSSPVRNQMKSKLESIMSSVVETSDFSVYVEKIKHLLSSATQGSSLQEYFKLINQMKEMVGVSKYKLLQKVNLSFIFSIYKEYASDYLKRQGHENYCDSDDLSEGQYSKEFTMSIEIQEDFDDFLKKGKLFKFTTTNDSNDDEIDDLTFVLELRESYDKGEYRISNEQLFDKNVLNLNAFDMEILSLKNMFAKIILDEESIYSSDLILWDYEG